MRKYRFTNPVASTYVRYRFVIYHLDDVFVTSAVPSHRMWEFFHSQRSMGDVGSAIALSSSAAPPPGLRDRRRNWVSSKSGDQDHMYGLEDQQGHNPPYDDDMGKLSNIFSL